MINRNDLRGELSKFDNLGDMLNFLKSKFDLSAKLGIIQKPLMIEGLLKAFDILNPKQK